MNCEFDHFENRSYYVEAPAYYIWRIPLFQPVLANRETCMLSMLQQRFSTRTASVIRHYRLSQMHLSIFSCIPSVWGQKWWPGLQLSGHHWWANIWWIRLFYSCRLSLFASLSLQQRWRELCLLSRALNQSRPLYSLAQGDSQRGVSKKLSGSKAFITSRSWPLSTPVESTAFDCLLVLLYLPGVIRPDWHMLQAVSFDNKAGERGQCWAHEHQNIVHVLVCTVHTHRSFSVYLQCELPYMLSLINSVLQCECGYRSPASSRVFERFNKS